MHSHISLRMVSIPRLEANLFVIHSSLNGNNGEWTNTDDIDSLSSLDRALLQVAGLDNRPSKSHNYQKKVNGGRNDPNDMSERNAGNAGRRVAEAAKSRVAEEKAKPKKRPTQKYVCLDGMQPGWDGKQAFRRLINEPNKCYGLNTGEVCLVATPFQIFDDVDKHGAGWVSKFMDEAEDDAVKVSCVIRTSWENLWVRSTFTHEGMNFSPKCYTVFSPAKDMLKKKFSTTQISEHLVNGMLACVNREFNLGSGDSVLLDTVLYYVHQSHETNWKVSREKISKTKVVVKDRVDEKYLSVLNIQRNNEAIVKFNSVDCEVVDKYPGRTDCLITHTWYKGCDPCYYTGHNPDNYQEHVPTSYPQFVTAEPNAEAHKYYRSQFLSFDGSDTKPFLTYSVNAVNCSKALKRMAGARETQAYDHYLTSMQYSAFGEVISRIYGAEEFVDDNKEFFNSGRIECTTRGGVFTRFKVGPALWDNFEVAEGVKIRRETYVTPYLRRCPQFCTAYELNEGIGPGCAISDLYKPLNFVDALTDSLECHGGPAVLRGVRDMVDNRAKLRDWCETDFGELPHFRGDATELNMIHEQMAVGFNTLLSEFRYEKVQAYADRHGSHWAYFEGWNRFLTMLDCETDRTWHAAITHVKKALRMMFVAQERVHTPTDIMVKKVDAKVKKEFAKFGKVPRLFVTYDAGCMFANELPEYAKVCLDSNFTSEYAGVTTNVCVFAKPGAEKLKTALNEAINSMGRRNHLNILIYSDDSLWSGNINGVDFAFNVDISSCDSGNKAGVFGLVYSLLSRFRKDLALGLVQQCSKVINLVNPEDKEERMAIEMATYFEGSGTVLTTILNHVAMYMIGQVAVCLFGLRRQTISCWEDVRALIHECGVVFGHVLSVEECLDGSMFVPEKMQFLKRSPLLTKRGEYIPCMNYGPIFRSFGSVEGDMVAEMVGLTASEFAEMSWNERWDLFASRVVAGLVNEPNSVVLQALRTRYPLSPKRYDSWSAVTFAQERLQYGGSYVAGSSDFGDFEVEDVSLARRYGVSVAELEELASQIGASAFGDVFPSSAVGAFFSTDYGLGKY